MSANCTRPGQKDLADQYGSGSQFGSGVIYDPETKSYISGNQETIVHEDWICEYVF